MTYSTQALYASGARHCARLCARLCALLAALLLSVLPAAAAEAHGGGMPRITAQPAGEYLFYVWSDPAAVRAGEPLHVSVSVTLPDGQGAEMPVTDAEVILRFQPEGAGEPFTVAPEPEPAVYGGFYEADVTLRAGGIWTIDVDVAGPQGAGAATFTLEVAGAPLLGGWLLWLVAALLLLGAAAALLWARTTDLRRKGAVSPQSGTAPRMRKEQPQQEGPVHG